MTEQWLKELREEIAGHPEDIAECLQAIKESNWQDCYDMGLTPMEALTEEMDCWEWEEA